MDVGEKGQEATEIATEEAIIRARLSAPPKVPITGFCNNIRCGEEVDGKPFCGAECRDAYDRMNKRR